MIKKFYNNVKRGGFAVPASPAAEGRNFILNPKAKGKSTPNISKAAKSNLRNKADVKSMMRYGLVLAESAMNSKIGKNNYFKLAELGLGALINGQVPMVHNNRYIKTKRGTIKSTVLHIGEPICGRYDQIPSFHSRNKITLIDTNTDCNDPVRKKSTVSQGGFNQRVVDFLDESTYITIEDLMLLTDCRKHVNKVKTFKKKKSQQLTKNKVRSPYATRIANTTLHSLISKVTSKYRISSDMSTYNTTVIIHICVLKNYSSCPKGPKEVRQLIVKEAVDSDWLQTSLRKDQILEMPVEEQKELDFKEQLILSVDSVLKKSTEFRKSIKVINTITRNLGVGDQIDLEIHQHFKKGINLNLLNTIKDKELPASSFLIVEFLGDPRAQLRDKKNGLLYNGYSPTKIRYDLSLGIEFTCSNNLMDHPIMIQRDEKHLDFDDLEIGERFYPTRENKFNVGCDNIQIGAKSTDVRYELMLDNESELLPTLDNIESLSELNFKSNFPFSEDDEKLNTTITDNEGKEVSMKEALLKEALKHFGSDEKDFESDHEGNENSNWEKEYEEEYENVLKNQEADMYEDLDLDDD